MSNLNIKVIISTICLSTFLFSCHSSKLASKKPRAESILDSQDYARDLFIKYQPERNKKWLEFNKLLEKDVISPEELNVTDCRGFNPRSEELFLKNISHYYILGEFYFWYEYETKNGRCILLDNTYSSFFLNQFEASILLSASIGHNFEKLNLELPKILFKRTILNDLKGLFCGGATIEQKENMGIHKDGCTDSIHYKYESLKPPKNTSQIQFLF